MIKLLKILVATHNKGKVNEFKELFAEYDIEVQSLLDFPEISEVEETGITFEENARLKAETIAELMQTIVLADDSGLSVNALNGEPGVFSARYAGLHGNSGLNNLKLLDKMQGVKDRSAFFTCCLVVAHPKMDSLVVEGIVNGTILTQLSGSQGFGYDPLFYVESDQKTFAELSSKRKNEISHRGLALNKLMAELPSWLGELKSK